LVKKFKFDDYGFINATPRIERNTKSTWNHGAFDSVPLKVQSLFRLPKKQTKEKPNHEGKTRISKGKIHGFN